MKKLLLLALSVALFSCSSDSDSDSGSGSGVAYIKGKMDGTAFNYTFNNSLSDQYFYNSVISTSGDGINNIYSYGGMLYPMTFTPSIMIAWDSMLSVGNGSDDTDLFYSSFDNTPENYLTDAQYQNNERGIDVQYEDAGGNFYNTTYGSQTGSSFNVASKTEGTDGGLKTITIKGTFSCKLYNSNDPTDVINITNGSYKLIVREDN
jgi:hypothetical protein